VTHRLTAGDERYARPTGQRPAVVWLRYSAQSRTCSKRPREGERFIAGVRAADPREWPWLRKLGGISVASSHARHLPEAR
jgi:hypothetical protein